MCETFGGSDDARIAASGVNKVRYFSVRIVNNWSDVDARRYNSREYNSRTSWNRERVSAEDVSERSVRERSRGIRLDVGERTWNVATRDDVGVDAILVSRRPLLAPLFDAACPDIGARKTIPVRSAASLSSGIRYSRDLQLLQRGNLLTRSRAQRRVDV